MFKLGRIARKSFKLDKFVSKVAPRRYFHSSVASKSKFEFSKYPFLKDLGIKEQGNLGAYSGSWHANGDELISYNPSTGKPIASVIQGSKDDYDKIMEENQKAFKFWRKTPVPFRGEIMRQVGEAMRSKKEALGKLISLEMGKIVPEGEGEVQEVIDICDYTVGLSRMLNGKVIPSERPEHSMFELWNPLGTVGVITAFNFPCAVYGWNAAIGMTCGNTMLWRGATSTPLTSIATGKIFGEVLEKNNLPGAISSILVGDISLGEEMTKDRRIPLLSFTGSTQVGKHVRKIVEDRFGKVILELGGNNAVIVHSDADIDMAVRGITFAAVGTAGQRCTTTRRLIVHKDVKNQVVEKLRSAYKTVVIGDPINEENVLCGPLHTEKAVQDFNNAVEKAKLEGGKLIFGGTHVKREGNFVEPAIFEMKRTSEIVNTETFAPILYVLEYETIEEAISLNNQVAHGLSSSLFTNDIKNMFRWIGPEGSDCGIVNVNIGTSGAEIGGAFGGEKETGVGRESGSDSWKYYMRRSTVTINHGSELPLAQGIQF